MKISRTKFVLSIMILAMLGISLITTSIAVHLYKRINTLALSPLALPKVIDTTKSISGLIIIGDSRAEQWVFDESFNSLEIKNLGVGGHTSRQALLRSKLILPSYKPRNIIIQVGINDLKNIPLLSIQVPSIIDMCKENITNLVILAKSTGAENIILTSIFPPGTIPFYRKPFWSKSIEKAIIEINSHIESLAINGVKYLDAHSILSNEQGIAKKIYQRDFLHIRKNGYNQINYILQPMLI